ncbi:MAG: hypothetical protein PSN44_08570 [Gammaproteobacteria bacterium]|nr:hypothetical protein [Gammaproteobacteria bacterium]
MTSDIAVALITAGSTLLGGLIVAYVVPRIKWSNEKERKKHDARVALLKRCRLQIKEPYFDIQVFMRTTEYSQIRHLLAPDLVSKIESSAGGGTIHIQAGGRGGGVNNFATKLLDEISQIERDGDFI